jgi:hypothetical protein
VPLSIVATSGRSSSDTGGSRTDAGLLPRFSPYSQLARPARTFLGKKTIEGTWAFMGHGKGLGLAVLVGAPCVDAGGGCGRKGPGQDHVIGRRCGWWTSTRGANDEATDVEGTGGRDSGRRHEWRKTSPRP